MKRILVFGMTENPGGIESFLMNYYRLLNKEKVQLDFLINSHNAMAYEDEIQSLGAQTFHIAARSENYKQYQKELTQFFTENAANYSAIWVNVCSLANIDYLKMAKRYGIKKRIIHSHNSQNMDSFLRGMLHKMNRKNIANYATDFWTCSEDAGVWFYSEKIRKSSRYKVIKNAIHVDKMAFDEEAREKLRNQYQLNEHYVIGNVGRLHFQKNQEFALDILAQLKELIPEVKLVLIGQGEDEEKLKQKVKSLNLEKQVLFAGLQRNIPEWLSAIDLFLFPSVFEGLSIAALEAQASGVPILASAKVIPEEVKVNPNFTFYHLDAGAKKWAQKIVQIKEHVKREEHENVKKRFADIGFDIEEEVVKLEKYLQEE